MTESANKEISDLELKLKNAENYNNYITSLYDEIKGFKHDFYNIINCIGGYIQADDMSGLKEYFSQFQNDINKTINLQLLNPNTINNPAIYNLLTTKYEKAIGLNINVNLEIFFDFNSIYIPIYEFSKILGILLDNAIEAAKDSEEKIINIVFYESKKKNSQTITIENTYSNKKVDISKIFQKGISNKQNHFGIGLWEVNKIIEKNKNIVLNTSNNEKFFKQEIKMTRNY